ncbi:TPA: recombinase family protein [Acinetobacter baumannii]|jgi:DNA invertase Pin-like site-specific DNA recombinase|uniref:recombinase family protein n=1 Tax=Acinetobacter pittii TaxID=48296 RepID=UPI00031582DD|nr:recombinase family protein [Acinetobacter pittii]SSP31827.1 site-specific recombinase, DNA invertase Pin [Acinetobacter pittii]HCA5053245.1 recombinase family protein [Acinetobacter baumannii]
MANIGYIRVSTDHQNTERQLDGLDLDKIFIEKQSGIKKEREQLKAMIDYVREGDTVFVHSIDRLGRSLIDLKKIVEQLKNKGVSVVFYKNKLEFMSDKSNSTHELMFNVLASFAQFERDMIKERQAEGIAKAKAKGVYKGKARKVTDKQILDTLSEGVSIRKTAELLGCGISTVQRVKKANL